MNKNFYINADVGEGMGDDSGLMPLIQACNIACGGHAGNSFEMQKTIALAQKYNVRIGAHPSYPDTKNFGRHTLNLSKQELYNSLKAQISSLLDSLKKGNLHHIKPHGALYHDCNSNKDIAEIVLEVAKSLCPDAVIFTSPNSILSEMAQKKGFTVWKEAFIDRAYEDDGRLVSRSHVGAVLSKTERLYRRLENVTEKGGVFSIHNNWIPLKAKTLCVHGDHPGAAQNLKMILDLYQNKYT